MSYGPFYLYGLPEVVSGIAGGERWRARRVQDEKETRAGFSLYINVCSSRIPPLPISFSENGGGENRAAAAGNERATLALRSRDMAVGRSVYGRSFTGRKAGYLKKKKTRKKNLFPEDGPAGTAAELSPREPKIRFYVLRNIYYFRSSIFIGFFFFLVFSKLRRAYFFRLYYDGLVCVVLILYSVCVCVQIEW